MSRTDDILRSRLKDLLEKDSSRTLYFFKGFGAAQVSYLIGHSRSLMNDTSVFSEGVLCLESLAEKRNAMLTAVKQADGPLVGFYEELLLLRECPEFAPEQVVVIYNNLLSPWQPSLLTPEQNLTFFDFQQEEHEPQTAFLNTLSRCYGDIKILRHGMALLLPVVADEPCIRYEAFWDASEIAQTDTTFDRKIELGSEEDWLYRLSMLEGEPEGAEFLCHLMPGEGQKEGLAAALTALQIPFRMTDTGRQQTRTYDDSAYLALLQKYWGADAAFRPLLFYKDPDRSHEVQTLSQGQIISEIVEQCELAAEEKPYSNVFITAPTGSGKSILFQLPAMYLAEKRSMVTIVVSPLIALMNDQVEQLEKEHGVSIAACLNSTMTMAERMEAIEQVRLGNKSLLYLAPELLLTTNLQAFLGGRHVGLVVIDEAHTVTSWGRDFRSDYWFLGDFLKKAKRDGMHFPVLCLTATAVYSGRDDVVNDTIAELGLERTIIHLGNVKRSNISFDICRHSRMEVKGSMEATKSNMTLERMRDAISKGEKVLTYFPYRSQVDQVYTMLSLDETKRIRRYHGKLSPTERKQVEQDYKSGEAMGLICTKAFGMGIDVSDIRHVIHFAPTGTLADYVQEIGRSARSSKITGTAHIDYFPSDLKYVRVLNSISEMRQYQLKEILKKICAICTAGHRNNLLISSETFEYLFPAEEAENRTKSGLMLLAKDLYARYHFPVLTVRPRAMLSKNYVHVPTELEADFQAKYGPYAVLQDGTSTRTMMTNNHTFASDTIVYSQGNTYLVDMAAIWENCSPEQSYGAFKKAFFEHTVKIKGSSYHFTPRVKVDIHYRDSYETVVEKTEQFMNVLVGLFAKYKCAEVKQFTQSQFEEDLKERLGDKAISHDKLPMLMDIFTEAPGGNAAFSRTRSPIRVLRRRKQPGSDDYTYLVANPAYSKLSTLFVRYLRQCVPAEQENSFSRFYPLVKDKPIELMPLLRVMELLGLANYEILGSEKAEVFLRIADPEKLQQLAAGSYKNTVLQAIQERHKHNEMLLGSFFAAQLSDEARWELIEQYFLGNEDYVNQVLSPEA